jgi:hypothetical protein
MTLHRFKVLHDETKIRLSLDWFTLWLFNIAMENGPFIDVFFPLKPPFILGIFHGYVSHSHNQISNGKVLLPPNTRCPVRKFHFNHFWDLKLGCPEDCMA